MDSDKAAVKPVAWRSKTYEPWMESYAWVFTIREGDVRPDHEPLYSAAAIEQLNSDHAAALEAMTSDRDSWQEQASDRVKDWDEMRRKAEAAERRVAEQYLLLMRSWDHIGGARPEGWTDEQEREQWLQLLSDFRDHLTPVVAPAKKVD